MNSWFHGPGTATRFGLSFGGLLAMGTGRQPIRTGSITNPAGAGAASSVGTLQQVAGLVLSRYPLPADNAFVNQFFNCCLQSPKPGPLSILLPGNAGKPTRVLWPPFKMVERFDVEARLADITPRRH